MKKHLLWYPLFFVLKLICLVCIGHWSFAQENISKRTVPLRDDSIPASYLVDNLKNLTERTTVLLNNSYMAQKFLGINDSIPGWEGYPVRLYEYYTSKDARTGEPKRAKVYLLNPEPEKLAMWILTTCWEVKKSTDKVYIDNLFDAIRRASGAQFPVMGLVYEDQYTRDYQEPYVFKDGVTVYVQDSLFIAKNSIASDLQIDNYLNLENSDLKPQTGRYARIVSTNREQYRANGGLEDVGDTDIRKQKWLDVVRELYKSAWHSDRNELLIAWAKGHL